MEDSELDRSMLSVNLQTPQLTESICDEMCNASFENEMCETDESSENGIKENAYRIVPNTYCTTIWYPQSKADEIDSIVKGNLTFNKKDPKKGEIYKNAEGSVTVTVYHSTGKLHVQGAGGSTSWIEYFDKMYKMNCDREEETECKTLFISDNEETGCKEVNSSQPELQLSDNEETECKGLNLSQPELQMSSTPKHSKVRSDDISEPNPAELSELSGMVSMLVKEIETLRDRLVTIECLNRGQVAESKDEKTFREIGTQTDTIPNKTVNVKPKSPNAKKNASKSSTENESTIEKTPLNSQQTVAKSTEKKVKTKQNPIESATTTKSAIPTRENPESNKKSVDAKSTLIIGSSITRNIQTRGLKSNVIVRSFSGAQVSDIRDEIRNFNLTGLREIIIQAGGNDVDNKRDLETIENDFAEIILDVQHRSPSTSVFISEVTPRRDLDPTEVNEMIADVCEMYSATVIKSSYAIPRYNVRQFRKDGTHLNRSGTRDLLYAYEQYVAVIKNGIKPKVCAYCGENGHHFRNCRHGGRLTCYTCGESGHKSKHCKNY